jgi:signal transduction histidine kinase
MSDQSYSMTIPAELDAGTVTPSQWMEGRLIADMMATARESQIILIALIPVFVGVLYGHVWQPGLVAWGLAATGIMAYRLFIMARYNRNVANTSSRQQIEFMRRYGYTWPLSGLIWGGSTFLHYQTAPLYAQFLCWICLTGICTFATTAFSAHLSIMRRYVNVVGITCVLPIIVHIVFAKNFRADPQEYVLLFLVFVYWATLHRTGTRLHHTQRASVQLQQANAELIRSLRTQTRTALEAVQAKNRFIASAAHDLRQPVHALSLYAEWLQTEPHLATELTPRILQSTKAVNELFDALFDLVRLDSGKLKPDWQEVRLHDLAKELAFQYAPQADVKGFAVRVRAPHAVAWSDPIMLRRILSNLLSNAIKHTTSGGVMLAIRPRGQTVSLEVWDTGPGIAPEHQQMIFKEFYRVPLRQGTEEGFGLGLSIVSRLAVALGHPLGLQSRVGRGTVFRLTLPLSRMEPEAAPEGD